MQDISVCFIGDSITASEKFTRILVDYSVLNFPKKRVRFSNAAIPGATLSTLLKHWDTLLPPVPPTYATLLFGINDMQRALYAPSAKPTPLLSAKKAAAISRYCENLFLVHEKLPSTKVLTLCPTPHEESPQIESPLYKGLDAALIEGAQYIRTHFTPHLDLHTLISAANEKRYVPTLIGDDRVHPGNIAHAIIAYHILEAAGIKAPRLPLWDNSFTEKEKAVLRVLGITENPAPKNPFSDERSLAERQKAGVLYIELLLRHQGISPQDTKNVEAFLKPSLEMPIEPWRKAAAREYLKFEKTRKDYEEAAAAALLKMYDAS